MVVRWLLIVAGWTLLGPRTNVLANGGASKPEAADGATASTVKLNSACASDDDCKKVLHSICNTTSKVCQCATTHPIHIGSERCVEGRKINDSCEYNEQCKYIDAGSICSEGICVCQQRETQTNSDGKIQCKVSSTSQTPVDNKSSPNSGVDPTMLAVLISLVVMFIIMCIVLRMFSKAQFRDQRTIFNSPRLMKKSLSKARAERRSSHASIGSRAGSRAGSRHASIQSGLNLAGSSPKHSPRGSRDSISMPNSNSVTHHTAPSAKTDDAVEVIKTTKVADNNVTDV